VASWKAFGIVSPDESGNALDRPRAHAIALHQAPSLQVQQVCRKAEILRAGVTVL
jgi:hypothetical protein